MHKLIGRFAGLCLEKQIITGDQVEWFIYGLEKRISTFLVAIPFFILAFGLSSIPCAVSFFVSFFFLRTYIGGFHSQTVLGCLIFSLLSEIAAFSLLYPVLNSVTILCIVSLCTVIIFIFTPYNHPNMHLTATEIVACKKKGQIRALIISAVIIAGGILGFDEIAKGSTLGIALTTAMLCLGYIFNGRISR